MLENFVNQGDVYGWLNTIREQNVPLNQRHSYYQPFLSMILTRDQSDQDAIIHYGQPVLHYRVETIRADLDRLRASSGDVVKVQPMVLGDDFIAEMIHVPNEVPAIKFVRYSTDGSSAVVDRINLGAVTYMPPQTSLVDKGVLLLPNNVEEYGGDGDLLQSVREFIDRYVYIQDANFKSVLAFWVMLSWVYDRFTVVPYLHVQGGYGVGKSRALRVIASICYRPILVGGATTAAPIFRIIERFHGTFAVDEADFNERDQLWSEIMKVFNIGYEKGGVVLRAERDGHSDEFEPKAYNCYGPKALATRRHFPDDALASRCFRHTMKPVQKSRLPHTIPLFLPDEFYEGARVLRNKLLLWRFRKYRGAVADPYQHLAGLEPRLNQILLPLLAVSDDTGLRESVLSYAHERQAELESEKSESFEGLVARCVYMTWDDPNRVKSDRLLMKAVNDRVTRICEEQGVKPLSRRRIGDILRGTLGLNVVDDRSTGQKWIVMTEADATRIKESYSVRDGKAPVEDRMQQQRVRRTPVN